MARHIDGPDKEFLTIDEAVAWLGMPEGTLRHWWESGKIPAPKTFKKTVVRFHWRIVVAIAELIACGHLDPEGDSDSA